MALGPFVIPQEKHHSTAGARRAFKDAFGQEWVGDDQMLRDAGRRFRDSHPKGKCSEFVIIMIETGDQPSAASNFDLDGCLVKQLEVQPTC